jgi:chromosomal replication initiator protein
MTPYSAPGIIFLTPTFNSIKQLTAALYFVDSNDVFKNTNKTEIVQCRQMCHYLAWHYKLGILRIIGENMGGKTHATVLNSIKKVENHLSYCKKTKRIFDELTETFDKRLL